MNPEVSLSPQEVILRLAKRVVDGEKLTRDEVRQGLDAYRQQRMAAATIKRTTSKAPTRSNSELLGLLTKSVNGDPKP